MVSPTIRAETVVIEHNMDGWDIELTGGTIFFRSFDLNAAGRRDFNFAFLALTLMSMSSGHSFELTRPVTRSALRQIGRYSRVLRVMKPDAFYTPAVICPNVIDDQPAAGTNSVICLSGGVDSTYAAMIGRGKFNNALFVRGADYPIDRAKLLDDLAERVTRIALKLNLTPIVVETNLKNHLSDYGLQHTGLLASCLYFIGSNFAAGGWAADDPYWGELVVFPWGNNAGLSQCLSLSQFAISHIGGGLTRSEKVAEISRQDRTLFKDMSSCFKERDTAANCGRCEKCMRTRLNLQAIVDEQVRTECELMLFGNHVDLTDYVRDLAVRNDAKRLKRAILNYDELAVSLPEGELKQQVELHLARLMNAGRFSREKSATSPLASFVANAAKRLGYRKGQ